ncbi:MAG: gliding motility-associated C-terminal domain-containing protein [Cryomorphaceae bacterium]|nr:gliding motility-associated C-terminal domain-containing protein [Cryomorphaceae bacterium]
MARTYIFMMALFGVFFLSTSAMQAQISSGNPLPEYDIDECIPYIPNAFTPNGDNINDKFGVKIHDACEMVEFTMVIFDRWGRKVFEAKNHHPDFWWDGTFDGSELSQGVYAYQIVATYAPQSGRENQIFNRQGTVNLIR